jgi:exodeoxyribonuclease V beta subunit
MVEAWDGAAAALEAWCEAFDRDLVSFVRTELPARARARGVMSFDDVLHDMQRALVGPEGKTLAATVRRRFPAAVIDEFHDTDPVQYDIFRRIYRAPNASLFLIGDPKQAIYAFRGADVYAYIAASHDADQRFTLSTNHRSDPTLIRAVNRVFSRIESPFFLDEIRFEPVSSKEGATDELRADGAAASGLEILFVPRGEEPGRSRRWQSADVVPELVAGEIAALLSSGATLHGRPLRAGDIAVLTRRNAEARDVQAALRALGVTAVLHGDSSVLDTEEAAETAAVLKALADPSNPTAVRSALATSFLGQTATELFELGEDEGAWERWTSNFGRWHEIWKTRGILSAIRRMMSDERASARLLGAPGGERRLTNFVHLVELLHKHAADEHAGMAGLIAWFDEVRHKEDARGGVAPDAQQVRLESDELAVQLTTMHRSKGLEYPVVFLPYLWRSAGLFPSDRRSLLYHDRSRDHRLVLDLRAEDQKQPELAEASRESIAEAQRLTYVALTRAKHRAVVVWGAFPFFHESALARLFHPRLLDSSGKAPDADLLGELDELATESDGAITVRSWTGVSPAMPPRSPPRDLGLRAKPIPSRRLALRRTSSFSGLTSGMDAPEGSIDDARDVDDGARAPDEGTGPPIVASARARVPLDEFPRGPRAGDALHGILEKIDFEKRDPEELARIASTELAAQGLDAEAWSVPVASALDEVLRTPLVAGGDGFSLSQISNRMKSAEMEFTFPVGAGTSRGRRQTPLTAVSLADALRNRSGLPRDYAERVAALGFAPLTGFLRGFIDLVFEQNGRFYLVDYKSNHLGSEYDSYAPPELVAPMAEHHYFLQYHLYAVAVHRFLRRRVRDYEYARHFGGVFYLFLRGMSPERGPRTGVFFDRPEEPFLDGLSRVLDAAAGEATR